MPRHKRTTDHERGYTIPLFTPKTTWVAHSFPNLSGESVLGIDVETRDPNLDSRGPGGIRGDGELVGVSISTGERSFYFPVRHMGGGNLPTNAVFDYVRDLTKDPSKTWVGANLQYELEWLETERINVAGSVVDVQVTEALIDEEQPSYALDALCRKYLDKGKDESLLKEAAATFGVNAKSGLWKLPAKFVGPYAEFDALSVMQIYEKQ
jgi:DNA polymerase I-like protein with 3'-5' exonuclease and polymerase domains